MSSRSRMVLVHSSFDGVSSVAPSLLIDLKWVCIRVQIYGMEEVHLVHFFELSAVAQLVYFRYKVHRKIGWSRDHFRNLVFAVIKYISPVISLNG